VEFHILDYRLGEIVHQLADKKPYGIFIEMDFTKCKCQDLIKEIVFLKSQVLGKMVPLMGVFPDEQIFKANEVLLVSGICFSFIKGGDLKNFCFDSYSIIFDRQMNFPEYATSRKLSYNYVLGLLSSLVYVDEKYFGLDVDCELPDCEIALDLKLFENLTRELYQYNNYKDVPWRYPMLGHYQVNIPFSTGWDSDEASVILQDTFDTWIEFSRDKFEFDVNHLLLLSGPTPIIQALFKESLKRPFHVTSRLVSDIYELEAIVEFTRPCIILVDFSSAAGLWKSGPDIGEMMGQMGKLIGELENYHPYVLCYNSSITSQALIKVMYYSYVVCMQSNISDKLLDKLLSSYCEKKAESLKKAKTYFFAPNDGQRLIEIKLPIIITSISENQITFFSHATLPMYSILSLNLPCRLYLTLIPPRRDLERRSNNHHYQGIIHGIGEKDLEILRIFVNQLIYQKIPEYTKVEVNKALQRKTLEATDIDANPVLKQEEKQIKQTKAQEKVEASNIISRTRRFKGKSKL